MTAPVTQGDVGDGTTSSDSDPARILDIDPRTLETQAQTAAGIGVPIEEVIAWIDSWTPEELPMPVARKLG